jgi:glycosyltransferase involved in cell wall biosynthesis
MHNNGYKKVHFLYNVPRQHIYTYVKKAYAYIMTSKWEAYPISLIEAMAAGVPWISTNVGIVKYLPGGFVADEISDISYWIEFIAKNEKVSQSLGNVGKVYASTQFKINKKVDQLENVILKAVKKEK